MRPTPGWCLAFALAACSHEEKLPPPPVPLPVQIGMDVERALKALPDPAAPAWALEGTWAVTEVRDAWTSALGAAITTPIGPRGKVEIVTAVALQAPRGADRDDATIEFEMVLENGGHEQRLALEKRSAHDAAHGWRELHVRADVPSEGEPRLVLRARASRPPAFDASALRACWAVPRVRKAEPSRRNVLIVSVDTLRADHLSGHGYTRPTTPHMDVLEARGVRFEAAIATAPWTLPSYGSLFTGLLPARHRAGVSTLRETSFGDGRTLENGDYEALAADCATLAERFRDAGFATAGIVSNPYFDAVTRIQRGFASWTQYRNRASAGVELAEHWIEAQGDAPWFLFLHLYDPHGPYTPPPPYDERFAGRSVASIPGWPPSLDDLRAKTPSAEIQKLSADLYDGEVAYTDEQVGALIAFLDTRGEMGRTLVVLHSDHGEELWDHGSTEHGHTLHEELLHVPLAFVMEGRLAPAKSIAQRTSLSDVAPTILELCELPPFQDADGTSLVPLLEGRAMEPRPCISEALLYGPREEKAWSTAGEKLITDAAKTTQLFDLANDPGEQHDVAGERVDRADKLRNGLVARWKLLGRGSASQPADFDREKRRELEKYGYPGGSAPAKPPK